MADTLDNDLPQFIDRIQLRKRVTTVSHFPENVFSVIECRSGWQVVRKITMRPRSGQLVCEVPEESMADCVARILNRWPELEKAVRKCLGG